MLMMQFYSQVIYWSSNKPKYLLSAILQKLETLHTSQKDQNHDI